MHPRLCKRPFLRSVLERQISLPDPWSCLCRRRAGGAAMLDDQSLRAKVCGTLVGTIVARAISRRTALPWQLKEIVGLSHIQR